MGESQTNLFLRKIGNVAGHGGGDDEASGLAFTEVQARGTGAVVDAVQVGRDDLVPLLHGGVEHTGVGGAAGIGDKDVDLAEVLDDVGHELLDFRVVGDIAFIGLGLDAVLVRQLFGVLFTALGSGRVCDGHVGAHLGAPARSLGADAGRSGGSGDDDDFALEAEEVVEGGG
jgi:hypothetical protein